MQNDTRWLRRLTLLVTMAAGIAAGLAVPVRAADWKDALAALEWKYKVTRTGWDLRILGKPERIFNLGPKVTYAYKDVRVVFVDGKVADVQ